MKFLLAALVQLDLDFYDNINDLSDKIRFYKSKTKLRNKIAAKGKKKYFRLFNEKRICKFITKTITGNSFDLF